MRTANGKMNSIFIFFIPAPYIYFVSIVVVHYNCITMLAKFPRFSKWCVRQMQRNKTERRKGKNVKINFRTVIGGLVVPIALPMSSSYILNVNLLSSVFLFFFLPRSYKQYEPYWQRVYNYGNWYCIIKWCRHSFFLCVCHEFGSSMKSHKMCPCHFKSNNKWLHNQGQRTQRQSIPVNEAHPSVCIKSHSA